MGWAHIVYWAKKVSDGFVACQSHHFGSSWSVGWAEIAQLAQQD